MLFTALRFRIAVMGKEKSNIGVYREIEKMDNESLMRNALWYFDHRYISLDERLSQVFQRALVVRGLATEEGARILAIQQQILAKR